MYRTDKQFMKNPATAACRIYIGGLAKTVIANDLEEKFKEHGNIVGLSLNTGFAFIQFENENEAQDAIKKENGTNLCGRKIVVKQANKPNTNQPLQQKPAPSRAGPQRSPFQDFSPKSVQQTPPPPPQNVNSKSNKNDFEQDVGDDLIDDDRPNIRPPGPPRHNDDKGFNKGGRRGGGGRSRSKDLDHDRFGGRFEPPSKADMYRDRDNFYGRDNRDYLPHRNEPFSSSVFEPPPPTAEKNDCEIIVVAKPLTEYAEFIEQKLKMQGLLVDLLFPNEDVPIGKVLANISSRGCLYAILVMPINEEHRSLTLNILHGIPQEHRNMPVDDAMILISRDFETYMKGENVPNSGQMTLSDRHPIQLQTLINLIAENRQINSIQYDKVIAYLQERRVLQYEYEVEEGITPVEETDPKQEELQNRIMNILNKSNEPPTTPDASSNEPTPILKDPTVQKALDSLILGDMFKNIAG